MMVVAEELMNKPTLKVSMFDSDSSSDEESDASDNQAGSSVEDAEAESIASEDENGSSVQDAVTEEESASSENQDDSSDEVDKADVESVSSNNDKRDALSTNEGWADSVAKILGSNKPKHKRTLVLSRAKKHSEIIKTEKEERPSFEVIGESTEIKPDVKRDVPTKHPSEPPVKKVKVEKPSIRLKPNVLEKDRERLLSKIATKGVVQLFNAVRNQQKTLEKDLDGTDITEGKKQKIRKSFDKRTFLDTLMGNTKSIVVDEEAKKTLKKEVKAEDNKPKWSALRDDFMMGAKMKDWDKESVDD